MLTGLVSRGWLLHSVHNHRIVRPSQRSLWVQGKQAVSVFGALHATMVLVYIRNIFRIVEFSQGFYGYLATHEEFFYGFDFAVVFGHVGVWCAKLRLCIPGS